MLPLIRESIWAFAECRNSASLIMTPISGLRLKASSVRLALDTSAVSSMMANLACIFPRPSGHGTPAPIKGYWFHANGISPHVFNVNVQVQSSFTPPISPYSIEKAQRKNTPANPNVMRGVNDTKVFVEERQDRLLGNLQGVTTTNSGW